MSKPDDFPDDVWEAARKSVSDEMLSHGFWNEAETYRNGGGDDEAIVLSAARAIMAERERCATIAEMHEHRGEIAAAIRKGE